MTALDFGLPHDCPNLASPVPSAHGRNLGSHLTLGHAAQIDCLLAVAQCLSKGNKEM